MHTEIIEEALNQASKYIAKKDCPRVIMDNEPWPDGCNKVCNNYFGTDEWKCWKEYFIKKATKTKTVKDKD